MAFDVLDGPNMPKPLGPYSQAIRAAGLIFVAGQPGLHPDTGAVAATFEEQARQAFENLGAVLHASGSSMAKVVKTTIFLADQAKFPELNALYREFFPERPPVRSTPVVALPRGLLISIDCIAVA
ncbi:MAG TPA: Rid family detoxifying hydrolase [Beijerinckiaceae bacterium]|nr:Rid family detoxifying hydrolase [Beijerinckiaceae bacterium]